MDIISRSVILIGFVGLFTACGHSNNSSGPTSNASLHLAFQTSGGPQVLSNIVVDRSYSIASGDRSFDEGPNIAYVDIRNSPKDPNHPGYSIDMEIEGDAGVQGLGPTLGGLNVGFTLYVPFLKAGTTQDADLSAAPYANPKSDPFNDPNNAVPIANFPSTTKCQLAISSDSQSLTFGTQQDGIYYANTLPTAPDITPDALAKFALAFLCVDSATNKDLVYGTYTQNSAAIPNL